MSVKKKNIRAFPSGESYQTTDLVGNTTSHQKGPRHNGMSLRDYFAAKALSAIIMGNHGSEPSLGIYVAMDAYAVADAMLEARER